jgi:hypothetical protein
MTRLTLNKLIVLFLLGGFLLLSTEVRFEHQYVLGKQWRSWIPVIYALLATVFGSIGLFYWEKWGRRLLLFVFSLSFVVGLLGTWFHAKGQPLSAIWIALSAWMVKPGDKIPGAPDGGPPELAPAAFIGLGIIGILCCLKRFSATSNQGAQ